MCSDIDQWMRIDQALDLGHSAITIQEDVRQSCGLSKLYGVRQPATCFVVKSSRKAKSVRQLLERSAALFLLLLPPCRSLERTAANWSILVSGTPPSVICERAQISNHSIPPPSDTRQRPPVQSQYDLQEGWKVKDYGPITNSVYLFKS